MPTAAASPGPSYKFTGSTRPVTGARSNGPRCDTVTMWAPQSASLVVSNRNHGSWGRARSRKVGKAGITARNAAIRFRVIRQANWSVTGRNFIAIHELIDDMCGCVDEHVNTLPQTDRGLARCRSGPFNRRPSIPGDRCSIGRWSAVTTIALLSPIELHRLSPPRVRRMSKPADLVIRSARTSSRKSRGQ